MLARISATVNTVAAPTIIRIFVVAGLAVAHPAPSVLHYLLHTDAGATPGCAIRASRAASLKAWSRGSTTAAERTR
jgi:hypothetical protein